MQSARVFTHPAVARQRFREIAGRYAKDIFIWDVVNESLVCRPTYPLYTPDRAYVGWAFAEAAPLFPDSTTLMINEVTDFCFKPADKNPYFAQVKSLLAQGAKVRGIGFQFHFFRRNALDGYLKGGSADPAKMLDLFAGRRLDDAGTVALIGEVFRTTGEVVDPHSAVGISALRAVVLDGGIPRVALATAHPAKFPQAIEKATGKRPDLPPALRDLFNLPERFTSLPNSLDTVKRFIRDHVIHR
jgi:hypothetical protein